MKNDSEVPDSRPAGQTRALRPKAEPESASPDDSRIPLEMALEVRRLIHDLSNGLEIIIQSSYLLSTSDLPDESRQWLKLLEQGVQKTANINQELRSYVREHS